mmetsp:Transcript_4563/g.8576  ORF Transcript_4563/g.8576 Transcript_4563/m.8576 type:complete len:268 (-) Transcript_4563:169-972(-)
MDSGTQDENPFLSGTEISPQTDVPLSFTESSYVPAVVEGNLDSRDEENAADQRVLLHDSGDGTSKPGVFSAERYQVYFNVDTKDVLRRIYDSMFIPGDGMGFLEKTTHQPDFYGPFWICTTLIFVTAAGGSAVEALNNKDEAWYYDVGEVTFSAFLFYGYATIVPIVLYFALRSLQSPVALQSLLCLYGYSLFIFIPISMLSVVNSEVFRWLIALFGCLESCAFLVLNLQSRLANLDPPMRTTVLGSVLCVHLLLGLVLKLHFFQYW